MHALALWALPGIIFSSAIGALIICILVMRYGFPPVAEHGDTPPGEQNRRLVATRLGHAAAGVCFAVAVLLAVVASVAPPRVAAPPERAPAPDPRVARLEMEIRALEQRLIKAESQLDAAESRIGSTEAPSATTERREPVVEPPRVPAAANGRRQRAEIGRQAVPAREPAAVVTSRESAAKLAPVDAPRERTPATPPPAALPRESVTPQPPPAAAPSASIAPPPPRESVTPAATPRESVAPSPSAAAPRESVAPSPSAAAPRETIAPRAAVTPPPAVSREKTSTPPPPAVAPSPPPATNATKPSESTRNDTARTLQSSEAPRPSDGERGSDAVDLKAKLRDDWRTIKRDATNIGEDIRGAFRRFRGWLTD